MTNTTIGGALLREMFLTGAALLDKNKALIDSLNVFPVPDGDTGTNMFMTMQGAVKEIKECKGDTVAGGCRRSFARLAPGGARQLGRHPFADSAGILPRACGRGRDGRHASCASA